jgi:predicted regulator of Ras-like GTPase activity (Roadblock/LC7/MglB family)
MSSEELNKKMTLYGSSHQLLMQSIQKFQILFACNINNFQQHSIKIVSIIFSSKFSAQESNEMVTKFLTEVDRLYDELFKDKIQEIVINFTDEETKIIPIL